MVNSSVSFSFKENILIRCFVSFFFGIAALVITVGAIIKIGDGPVWIGMAVAALLLALSLFYFIIISIRNRQVVKITPQEIIVTSQLAGTTRLAWREMTDIKEVQTRLEKVRSAAPLVEVMLSLYLNLPFLAGIERRGLVVFEAGEARSIALRQHLIYPHRMEELRSAIARYAPARSRGEDLLKVNLNN